MTKLKWKRRIVKACNDAGTYQSFFDDTIDSLAGILELRDNAEEQFVESGGKTVIEYTNKNGVTNTVKNPAMVIIMECNAQALTYWKELGLTSRAYKAMNGSMTPDNGKTLEDVLSEMGI